MMSNFPASIAALALAGLATGFAGPAAAQQAGAPSAYVGGNLGLYNKYDLRCGSGVACDRTAGFGGKVYGGYDYGSYGIEALAFSVNAGSGLVRQGTASVAGSVREQGLGVVGVLPLQAGDFTLKGKLGLAYTRGKVSYAAGGSDGKKMFAPLIGASVSYPLSKDLSLSADWDQLRAKYNADNRVRVNMLSVGISHKF